VLARLDRIDGVERSYANRSGTLLRLSLSPSADPDRVAGEVPQVVGGKNRTPTRLVGQELAQALEREEWRAVDRVGELSDIECRTVALRWLLRVVIFVAAVGAFILLFRRLRRTLHAARNRQ
jgi:hypothetical protein